MAANRLTSASAPNDATAPLMSQIELPNGVCAFIIHKDVLDHFSATPHPDQRYVVQAMKGLIRDIRKDGSPHHLATLGIIDPQKSQHLSSAFFDKFKHDLLLEFHWKLIQYLRFSTPTRIEEAIPLIENFFTQPVSEPLHRLLGFYGAVAYSRIPGKEHKAIDLYKETSKQMIEGGTVAPILTYLWAKANIARLTRKMKDVSTAEVEELYVRNWILNNPWIISPDVICKLIDDELDTGAYISKHPDVRSLFSHLRQLGSAGNYTPMMQPTNSNLDLVIVDNQTQTMCYDTEPFAQDKNFRIL